MTTCAVWSGPRSVHLEDRPAPRPRDDEAVIRVLFCGLCGSDVEEYLHGPVVAVPARVLGHEFSGVVVQAAADGSGPASGTIVVVDVVIGCRDCHWCDRHEEGLCANLRVVGQHMDGGLTEHIAARADRLVPVPASVSPIEASLAEPLAVAVRALRKVDGLADRQVLVLGGGTIGMLTAQVARAWGARNVSVIEPHPSRRALIARWGIESFWSDSSETRSELVARAYSFPGPDVVVECAGRPGLLQEALHLVAPAGVVLALGVSPELEPIDALDMVLAEKTLRGSAAHMWDTDVADAVRLIASGDIDVASLITHVLPLDAVVSAFEVAAAADGATIKVVVACSPTTGTDLA